MTNKEIRAMANIKFRFNENPGPSSFILTPVTVEFAENDGVWIEALEARTYHTPQYGEVVVTPEKLDNFVKNFKGNVRGIDITTDFEHGTDPAKGKKASGTIKDIRVDGKKLLLNVNFTDTAKREVHDGEWKYFSTDWLDKYVHEDGSEHVDVLLGGGLTNRPVAKGLAALPINFSELYGELEPEPRPIEGEPMNELLKRMAEQLGIQFSETDDEDEVSQKVFTELTRLETEVTNLTTEVEPLRKLKKDTETQKSFAEQYPEQAAQMVEDRRFRIEAASDKFVATIGSKRFSESVGKKDSEGNDVVIVTTKGLSAKALDLVKATHLKFSEGNATVEDFTQTFDAIFDNGIVDYGEAGTSVGELKDDGDTPVAVGSTTQEVRLAFAEKITEIEAEVENRTFKEALVIAAGKYPKMYDAYMGSGVIT